MRRYWTAVETFSASSGDAVRALRDAGFPLYHPKYREPRFNGVRRVLPLFAGYVFVQVTKSNWCNLRVDDVKKTFRCGDFVYRVEKRFIDVLQNFEDRLGYVDVDRLIYNHHIVEFLPGEMVRGLYGLLKGTRGEFLGYEGDGYARVLVRILGGREWEAHVDAHELIAA